MRLLIITLLAVLAQLLMGLAFPSPVEWAVDSKLSADMLDGLVYTILLLPAALFAVVVDRIIALKDLAQNLGVKNVTGHLPPDAGNVRPTG